MNREITCLTRLEEETYRELVFMPITTNKVMVPKMNLTKEERKTINQDIYLNCMFLKKNLVR